MLFASFFFVIIALSPTVKAVVPCNNSHDLCEELLFEGSTCKEGFCTNPWEGGCLGPLLASEEYAKKYGDDTKDDPNSPTALQALRRRLISTSRVCNSEDVPDAAARGVCAENSNDYQEVRIWGQNWESAFALSWIMQIIYSEILSVPATIETGVPGKHLNFYGEKNPMDYGKANEYAMFQHAYEAEGDCTKYQSANADASAEAYIPCAHINVDVWVPNEDLYAAQKSGYADSLQYVGMVGFQGWHISKRSLRKDSSLATQYGLAGNENRQKLAKIFKRPTTWKDYCSMISSSNCTVSDDVAVRPPAEDGSEDGRYFAAGAYTGYFRATEKNDCNKTEKCTGHFIDYPCGWTSFMKQQTHHLGIALESDGSEASGGYTYYDMLDIWLAANATQSDVIGMWWTPDALPVELKGTDSEMTIVTLAAATQECLDNRIDVLKRCDANSTEFDIYGNKEGACGEPLLFTQKIAVAKFQEAIKEGKGSLKSKMSPAYDVYKEFSITALQVGEILKLWTERRRDRYNFDLRYATCKWLADNLDHVQSFIPENHPRSFARASQTDAVAVAALASSAIAIASMAGTTCGILYLQQQSKLRGAGQIEFLLLLLAGLFFVSMGSTLLALEPSDATCIGAIWTINVGYTIQLVPTIIRVWTIITIVRASMRMRIVNVDKKKLLTRSIGISALAAVYCAVWTGLDPPQSKMSLYMTSKKNDFGETIVQMSHYCDSESTIWFVIMFVLQGFLLVCGSVMAYQMRSVPNDVNDSKQLAIMIYSSFIFLVLRFVAYIAAGSLASNSLARTTLQKSRSLFCSIDTIANILIFFPRFFIPEKDVADSHTLATSRMSSRRSSLRSSIRRSSLDETMIRLNQGFESPVTDFRGLAADRRSSLRRSSLRRSTLDETMIRMNHGLQLPYAQDGTADQRENELVRILRVNASENDAEEGSTAKMDLPKWVLEKYGKEVVESGSD